MKVIEPAKRIERVTYAIRDVVVEAKRLEHQGKRILYLNIGDPNVFDFKTPDHLLKAAYEAMQNNKNGYGYSLGLDEARESIAKHSRKKGLDVDENDIIITTGVSEGIDLLLTSLVNQDENILLPSPCYPVYLSTLRKLEVNIKFYKTIESDGWQPDLDDIRKKMDKKTKALVLVNPNNPTGAVYERKTLEEIVDIARENDILIISDEIYDRIIFDGKTHTPVASIDNEVHVVTLGGLSKNYLAPGWRIGWMIFSGAGLEKVKNAVQRLARVRLSSPSPFQYAVKPALEGDQSHIEDMVSRLQDRRDFIYKRLNEIDGLSCEKPLGAFYAFPKIHMDIDDKEFVYSLLKQKGVLTVFGSGFGYSRSDHFRIVFLPPIETLEEAMDKMEEFVCSLSPHN